MRSEISLRMLASSSLAARLVNVVVRMFSGRVCPDASDASESSIHRRYRFVRVVVLPVPAPAVSVMFLSSVLIAVFCSHVICSKRTMLTQPPRRTPRRTLPLWVGCTRPSLFPDTVDQLTTQMMADIAHLSVVAVIAASCG
jgi:hypothetical protein